MEFSLLQKMILGGAIAILVAGGVVVAMEPELTKIHKKIEAKYASVEHIDGDDYTKLDPSQIVVFDVRERSEFDVSHLDGAVQVDPGISADAFAEQYKEQLNGKTVVFYCSVGRRSSKLADRVDGVLAQNGASASYNLIGGLFQWRNEERSLMSQAGGTTDAIHPYNAFWGRLIEDKSAIRYRPSPQKTEQESQQ